MMTQETNQNSIKIGFGEKKKLVVASKNAAQLFPFLLNFYRLGTIIIFKLDISNSKPLTLLYMGYKIL